MRFTLAPECKQIPKLTMTLTEAIHQFHGARSCDGALPLGAYFDKLDPRIWEQIENIWYRPRDEFAYSQRTFDPEVINIMRLGMEYGSNSITPSGQHLTWIQMDGELERLLPN
ncbi:hypothetical protein EGC78_20525 [Shewanella frigidimarina]|nr:hypothetical protein EGC78_20525 [Shewanella frigidimarina]